MAFVAEIEHILGNLEPFVHEYGAAAVRGGEKLLRLLFEPLGWNVDVEPTEGATPGMVNKLYARVKLTGSARISVLLNHLYVLIPVLDNAKHYWVGEDEIDKLLKRGEGWLDRHPAKELIVRRSLRHRGVLARAAFERLAPETQDEAVEPKARSAPEEALEAPIRLNNERMTAVVEAFRATGAKTIADLGCGEGKLLHRLLRERWVERLIGVDPAARELEWAAKRGARLIRGRFPRPEARRLARGPAPCRR